MSEGRKIVMLPPGIVLGKKVAEALKAHGIVTTPVKEEVLVIVNEAGILMQEVEEKLAFEMKRAAHDLVPDMIDRGFYESRAKWNDAPAWTPGGGAPRRRGRRRS